MISPRVLNLPIMEFTVWLNQHYMCFKINNVFNISNKTAFAPLLLKNSGKLPKLKPNLTLILPAKSSRFIRRRMVTVRIISYAVETGSLYAWSIQFSLEACMDRFSVAWHVSMVNPWSVWLVMGCLFCTKETTKLHTWLKYSQVVRVFV